MEACYSELVQSQLFTLCRCQTNFSFTTAVELLLTWRRNWLKYKYALYNKLVLEGVTKKSRLTNCRFTTISSQISAIYINIFHKTEVQTVILRCWTVLYINWLKSYDKNEKHAKTQKTQKSPKTVHTKFFFYKIPPKRKWEKLHFLS